MSDTKITEPEFGGEYAREQIRRSLNPLRRFIKGFYLSNILKDVQGPGVDFGCGAGQLLRRMPPGSVGIEVNPHLIESHKTFINRSFVAANIPKIFCGYRWSEPTFFPENWEWIGRYFVFHEMKIVFDQIEPKRR